MYKSPEQVLKAVRFIDKRFPFLKPIFASEQHYVNNKDENKGKNPGTDKNYNEVIKAFLSALNELRNYFSHVDHKPFIVSVELERYLDKILEAAVIVAKQRNTFSDEEVNHLVKYKYKEDKRSRTFERFVNPSFKYPFIKDDRTFTEHGIAFFVCLFLEKQYISEFLGQLKGYKDRRERDFRATIESYKVFTLDVPYDRIECTEPRFALALDMLNDLKRCPDDLFEQLSKINKDYFRVRNTSSEEQVEEVINNEVHPDSLLQKRYNDRFPFFALSYLDQMDAFKFTRFQVDMGSYFYQFYQKEMVDSDSRLRSVGTSLNGFGKPAELNTARLEKWKDLIVTNPPVDYDKPYITDTKPHYHFVNDTQIGLRFAGSEGYYLPPIKEDGTELQAPEAWLSIYELPALLFFCWLTQNNDKYAAELVIQDYVKQVRKLFSDISLGKLLPQQNRMQAERILLPYNIEFVNLPNDIKNYLIGKKVDRTAKFTAHARRITDLFVHQTQRLLDKIEKDINTINGKGNKYGKKKYVEIKSGVLADFLVKDIIRLQPSLSVDNKNKKDGRDKLTGPNFQVLQAQLAFYGRDYKSLKSTFTRSGLIGGNNPHPFLHKINTDTITDIVSFYIEYLKKRKEYFAVCLSKANFASYYFLKQNQLKWSNSPRYYSDLAERYNKLPVNLPRGLFLDELRLWFSENGSLRMKELVAQPQKVNTIYLLQKYAEFELNDQSQEFYTFKRTYKCANKLEGTKVGNKTTSVYYSSFDLANKINGWKRRIKALPPKPEKTSSLRFAFIQRAYDGGFARFD